MNERPTTASAPGGGAGWGALGREIAAAWRQFPGRELFLAMVLGWVLLFQFLGNSTLGYVKTPSLFGWMVYAYEMNPDDAHGYFIPILVLVLLWWKRGEWLPLPKRAWWPGLIVLLLASALHAAAFMIQQTRLSIAAFYLGLYALTGILWGRAWLRTVLFPFCLLVFCVPLGTLSEPITFPLRQLATSITVKCAHWGLGIEVIQKGTLIFDPSGRFQYEIAAACSGLRSLTALFVLTWIYGFVFFKKYWQRGLILLLAFPAAVLSNVLRLLMIVMAAQFFGQAGGNYVHDSTWLSFLPYVAGFALVYLVGRWIEPKAQSAGQEGEAAPPPKAPAGQEGRA